MFNWFKKEKQNPSPMNEFKGNAIVSLVIRPHRKGQVYFRGGWWTAKCSQDIDITLEEEELVEVLGFEGESITLLVKPIVVQ